MIAKLRHGRRNLFSPTATRFQLALLLIAGWGLRIHRLGDKSVWWDEGLAIWSARQSLAAIANWTAHDVHPPLYFWLLHVWRLASGDTEFGLRLLSALIGVLTIAAAYLLGRAVAGRATGLLAALFLVVSRFAIIWSQEMRMYALSALLAALALWTAVRVWEKGRWRDWLGYVLFMTAGLYTLYLSVLVLVVVNLTWLAGVWPRATHRGREFLRWSAAQAAVLLLFAPWLAYALPRIPTWSSANPVTPLDFIQIYWTMLTVGIPLNVAQYAHLSLPVLGIFVLGTAVLLWQGTRRQRRLVGLFLAGLLLPAAVVYLVSLPKETFFYAPPVAPRYLIIFLAAHAVLLAWGITRVGADRRWPLGVLLAGVVLYAAVAGMRGYYSGRLLHDDYLSLVRTIDVHKRPSDAVILFTDTDWPIFAYHHPEPWRGVPHAWQITPDVAGDYLESLWADHDGIWLVVTPYAGVSDPQGNLAAWLEQRATVTRAFSYGDKALQFHARTDARGDVANVLTPAAAPQYKQTAVLGDARLAGYDQALRDARSGDTVHLALYWQGNAAAETAVIGFVDGSGQTWQETPVELPPARNLTRRQFDLTVSPDTPSGAYHLFVRGAAGEPVKLGAVTLRQRGTAVLTPADVTISNRVNANFENGIRLLGYDVATDAFTPGGAVPLTLYWQAQEPVTQPYKVFTHLLGEVYNAAQDNFLWGQQDNEPVNNTRPTTTWRTGEVIVDSYAIPIAGDAPPGPYRIEIGLYDPATGTRLPLEGGADHLILDTITIDK